MRGIVIPGINAQKSWFLARAKIDIPLQRGIPMRPYEPAVLPRLVFESGEISLSGVGGFRDHGIVEIVKHVWQGGESHNSRARLRSLNTRPRSAWRARRCPYRASQACTGAMN